MRRPPLAFVCVLLVSCNATRDPVAPVSREATLMSLTVTIKPFNDAGPNTFNNFGAGATQTARITDGDDGTGIRYSPTSGQQSFFGINPADIPANLGVVTQVEVVSREAWVVVTAPCAGSINCYVNGELVDGHQTIAVAPIFIDDYTFTLLNGGQTIPRSRLATMQIAFEGGVITTGSRWSIHEATIRLTYVPRTRSNRFNRTGEGLLPQLN